MPSKSIFVLLSVANALACGAEDVSLRQSDAGLTEKHGCFVTNVAQFSTLSGADSLAGCHFHLTGVVSLVDTNRDLTVLQDTTGAVALNFRLADFGLQFGQFVTLD